IGSNSILADVNTINMAVDGKLVNFPDQRPYIDNNNRTMVPVRFPAETLGANVDWLPNTRQVHIINKAHDALKDADIMVTIDKKDVVVNGQIKIMDTTAVIANSRTMVPVRFISEYLGAVVTWHQDSNAAHVFTKGQTVEEQNKIMKQIAQELKKQQTTEQNGFIKPPAVKQNITTRSGSYVENTYECKKLPIEVNGTRILKLDYVKGTPEEVKYNIDGYLNVTKNTDNPLSGLLVQGDFGWCSISTCITSEGTCIPNGDGTFYNIFIFGGKGYDLGTPMIEEVKKIGFDGADGVYFIDNPYYKQ
ncbi:stalk domain-containing protein, partial [Syntrophomonas sp.]|uniref:stalk domain-containing protein n=1 Tax=Syntrophomonas sp. TaxID=2053627 RepID=UPI0034589106